MKRGARFFAVAFLLNRYGARARNIIEKRFGLWTGLAAVGIVIGFVVDGRAAASRSGPLARPTPASSSPTTTWAHGGQAADAGRGASIAANITELPELIHRQTK